MLIETKCKNEFKIRDVYFAYFTITADQFIDFGTKFHIFAPERFSIILTDFTLGVEKT